MINGITRAKTSLVAQTVKRLPTMREAPVQSLGGEDPLEKDGYGDDWMGCWIRKFLNLGIGRWSIWIGGPDFRHMQWELRQQSIPVENNYPSAKTSKKRQPLASSTPIQRPWIWANSGRWWGTGRPRVLWSMDCRVGQEEQQRPKLPKLFRVAPWCSYATILLRSRKGMGVRPGKSSELSLR